MKGILRLFGTILALVIIAVGLVLSISPIPFGLILVLIGFVLLAVVAPGTLRNWRSRWSWLDRFLDRVTPSLPDWLARRLNRSDPPANEDEDEKEDETNERAVYAETPAQHARRILMR